MEAKKRETESAASLPGYDPERFAQNLLKISEQSQMVMTHFLEGLQESQEKGGKDVVTSNMLGAAEAFAEVLGKIASNPGKFWQSQMELFTQYMQLWGNASMKMLGEPMPELFAPQDKDRRFHDEGWQEHMVFDYLKQSYLLTANWAQKMIHDVDGIDPAVERKIEFYTQQFVDAMSPSNYLFTNPEVLRKTLESNGENLIKGLKNLLGDLEESEGSFQIKTADKKAFEVGKNLATTPGKVVFQNDLIQLIQYTPSTKKVFKTPLLVVSPWINKYYVLDMQPENSLVKWLVDQGHTVFVVSWVNPTAKHAGKTFEDYMKEGPLAALDAMEKATGEKQANVIGYCIGGTLMAATLAYLKAKGKGDKVRSITYYTTLVDFADPGDLGVFIDDAQLEKIEEHMQEFGFLPGTEMSSVFSILRANDMIWSSVVNNYLLGKDPLPFDLLYWNSDSTALPQAMHSFYLRNMYQKNMLVKPGGIKLGGVPIDIRAVDTPSYILSTKEDHIAPWQATYKATQLYKGKVRFVLSGSGHVAGVVNPPAKKKYSYWTNEKNPASPAAWLKGAKEHKHSWWEDWQKWTEKEGHAGAKVDAREPGDGKLKPIEDAPGSYVKKRS